MESPKIKEVMLGFWIKWRVWAKEGKPIGYFISERVKKKWEKERDNRGTVEETTGEREHRLEVAIKVGEVNIFFSFIYCIWCMRLERVCLNVWVLFPLLFLKLNLLVFCLKLNSFSVLFLNIWCLNVVLLIQDVGLRVYG